MHVNSEKDQPGRNMLQLINGFQVSRAISVAARLGLADRFADQVRTCPELATETGSDEDALYRLMRALATVGIFEELTDRQFRLTELGSFLRTDTPGSMAGWARYVGEPSVWSAWGELDHSVATGQNAFLHVHGIDAWTYRAQHPEVSKAFVDGMTALSGPVAPSLLRAFDFGRFTTIADIGGSNGAFLMAILGNYPALKGILFDHPHVVSESADLPGFAAIADRCTVIGGSFFDSVPAGADAYVMKSILHDWEDGDCIRILTNCRQAMSVEAALLVIERDLEQPGMRQASSFSDLNMLTLPGGRERTADEYTTLFAKTGFQFVDVTQTTCGRSVFKAVAI
jgi:O-methyltransferase domain/Dimerisation domain